MHHTNRTVKSAMMRCCALVGALAGALAASPSFLEVIPNANTIDAHHCCEECYAAHADLCCIDMAD